MTEHLDGLIFDYAAGAMGAAASRLMEAHFEMRPRSGGLARALDVVGGDALMAAAPAAVRASAGAVLAHTPVDAMARQGGGSNGLPIAISDLFPNDADIEWSGVWPGVAHARSDVLDGARLLRAKAGSRLPKHAHDGQELTLVLTGGFRDRGAHYRAGDISVAGPEEAHELLIDDGEECLCFTAVDGDLKLSGPLGAVLSLVGLGKI
ncbi:MAG: cupin domain-containing protein [Pseudomonadota bacterium]